MHHLAEALKLFEGISRLYLDQLSREYRDWPAQPNSTRLSDQDAERQSDGLSHFRYLRLRHRPSRGRDVRNETKAAARAPAYIFQSLSHSCPRWLVLPLCPRVVLLPLFLNQALGETRLQSRRRQS